MILKETQTDGFDPALPWIDPIGGLGDCLWLSSVLHDVWRATGRTFGLCRKAPYAEFFRGHPAIPTISVPPLHFPTIHVDYWTYETLGPGRLRPYQILSRMFGLDTPREESLWAPIAESEYEAVKAFPIDEGFIVVAPSSISPRKTWPWEKWAQLVQELRGRTQRQILQFGLDRDPRIPGTLSLCGMTSPRQLIALMRRAVLAVAVDAFPLHAASMAHVPTIALWGPSHHEIFGHDNQENIQAAAPCRESCFGPRKFDIYLSACDVEPGGCLNRIEVGQVLEQIDRILAVNPAAE
jgi:hypothetical protein